MNYSYYVNKDAANGDNYMTPRYAWENIKHFIPKGKIIWEPFYGDGLSGTYLRELGFQVIHKPIDFFKHNEGDIIVTNPPFSKLKPILHRLKCLQKPFILIMPSSKLNTKYFRQLFAIDKQLQIVVPNKRIQFVKGSKRNCNFDCFYYCWMIGLEDDITFL